MKEYDMYAEKLMHDDWVLVNGTPSQVWLEDILNIQLGAFDVEPITLTEEILKANGFLNLHSDFQRKYNIWVEDKHAFIEYNFAQENNNFNRLIIALDDVFVINLPILYVHELQHALRLCGLNGLVDNFKVE